MATNLQEKKTTDEVAEVEEVDTEVKEDTTNKTT